MCLVGNLLIFVHLELRAYPGNHTFDAGMMPHMLVEIAKAAAPFLRGACPTQVPGYRGVSVHLSLRPFFG